MKCRKLWVRVLSPTCRMLWTCWICYWDSPSLRIGRELNHSFINILLLFKRKAQENRNIQVEFFWVVTPRSVVVWYQCLKGHPEDGGSTDLRNVGILPQHYAASQSRRWRKQGPLTRLYPTTTLVASQPRRWRQHGPPKRWCRTTTPRGVTTQNTSTWIFTAVKSHPCNQNTIFKVL